MKYQAGPKIVYPDIYEHQSFAYDDNGLFVANTCYFIPTTQKWFMGVLNSPLVEWFYGNTANRIRGGYLRAFSQFIGQIPVPPATPEERWACERLAETLIWLHAPSGARKTGNAPLSLMKSYFDQWLNGLVYELFFPGELHARKLKLFDETARLNPPDLSTVPQKQKLVRLQELFAKAHDGNAPLRAMLFDLPSLEVVRIIEDAIPGAAVKDAPDEE